MLAEKWENQRRRRKKFLGQNLLPTDLPPFSDAKGRANPNVDACPPGWTWASPAWTAEQWYYGVSWADLLQGNASLIPTDRHCVRRRRLTRPRRPVSGASSQQTASPLDFPTASSFGSDAPAPTQGFVSVEAHGEASTLSCGQSETVGWLMEEFASVFSDKHRSATHIVRVLGLWLVGPDGAPVPGGSLDPATRLLALFRSGAGSGPRLWARLQVAVTVPPSPVLGLYLDARPSCPCPVVRRLAPAPASSSVSPKRSGRIFGLPNVMAGATGGLTTSIVEAVTGGTFAHHRAGGSSRSAAASTKSGKSVVISQRSGAVRAGMRLLQVQYRQQQGRDAEIDLSACPPKQAAKVLKDLQDYDRSLVFADPAPGAGQRDSNGASHGGPAGRRSSQSASRSGASGRAPPYRLVVSVLGARGLKRADFLSSDPYVLLRVAGSSKRTKVVFSSTSPTWNETFEYALLSRDCVVVAEIWDHDDASEDDPLGEVILNLGDAETFPVNPPRIKVTPPSATSQPTIDPPVQQLERWWDVSKGKGQLHLRVRIDQDLHLAVISREENTASMVVLRTIRVLAARRARRAAAAAAGEPLPDTTSGTAVPTPVSAPLLDGRKAVRQVSDGGLAPAAPLTIEDIFPKTGSNANSGNFDRPVEDALDGLSEVTSAFLAGEAARQGAYTSEGQNAASSFLHDVRIDVENKRAAGHSLQEGVMQDSTSQRYPAGGSSGGSGGSSNPTRLVARRIEFSAQGGAAVAPNEVVARFRAGRFSTQIVYAASVKPDSEELLGALTAPVLVHPRGTVLSKVGSDHAVAEGTIKLRFADGVVFPIEPGDEYAYWRVVSAIACAAMDPASGRPRRCGSSVFTTEPPDNALVTFRGELERVGDYGRVMCELEEGSPLLRWSAGPTAPVHALDLSSVVALELSHDNPPACRHLLTVTLIGGDFTCWKESSLRPLCQVSVRDEMRATRAVGGARPFWNTHFSWAVSDRDIDGGGGVRIRAISKQRFTRVVSHLGDVTIPFSSMNSGAENVTVGTVPLSLQQQSLKVHLKSATGLPISDSCGTSDPFAVLIPIRKNGKRVDDEKEVSKTVKKNCNPEWNEVFEFGGKVATDDLLGVEIRLFDRDRFDADDLLGRAFCPIEEFGDAEAPAELCLRVLEVEGSKVSLFRKFHAKFRPGKDFDLGFVSVALSVHTRRKTAESSGEVKIRLCLEKVDAFSAAWPALALPHAANTAAEMPQLEARKIDPVYVSCGFGNLVLRSEPGGGVAVDLTSFLVESDGGATFVEVWEHQRHLVYGWGSERGRHLNRDDPAKFTDFSGTQALAVRQLKEVQPLPGWQWAGEWQEVGEWFTGKGSFAALAEQQERAQPGFKGKGDVRRRPWRRELRQASNAARETAVSQSAAALAPSPLESLPAALLPFCVSKAREGAAAADVVLEVFENQRHQPAADWGSTRKDHLLGADPSKYSDTAGIASLDSLHDIAVDALEGFAPVAATPDRIWQVSRWQYASDFSRFLNTQDPAPEVMPQPPSGVRRRKWSCTLRRTNPAAGISNLPTRRRGSAMTTGSGSSGSVPQGDSMRGGGEDVNGPDEMRLALEGVKRVCVLSDSTLLVEWRPLKSRQRPAPVGALSIVIGPCPAAEMGSLLLERINITGARATLSHVLQRSLELRATANSDETSMEALTTQAGVLLQALEAGISAYSAAFTAVMGTRRAGAVSAASVLWQLDESSVKAASKALWCRLVRLHAYMRELICSFPRGRLKRAEVAGDWNWAAVMHGIHADVRTERQRRDSGEGEEDKPTTKDSAAGGTGQKSKSSEDLADSVAVVMVLKQRLESTVAQYLLSANCTPQEELRYALGVLITSHYIKVVDEVGRHISQHSAAATLEDKDLLNLLDLLLTAGNILSQRATGILALLGWDVSPRPLLSEAISVDAILASYSPKVETKLATQFENAVRNATVTFELSSLSPVAADVARKHSRHGSSDSASSAGSRPAHKRRGSADSQGSSEGAGASIELLELYEINGKVVPRHVINIMMELYRTYATTVAKQLPLAYSVHAVVLRAGANALSALRNRFDAWAQRVADTPWLPLEEKIKFLSALSNDALRLVTAALPELEQTYAGGFEGAAESVAVTQQLWLALGQSCVRRMANLVIDEGLASTSSPPQGAGADSEFLANAASFTDQVHAIARETGPVANYLEDYWYDKLLAAVCDSLVMRLCEGLVLRAVAAAAGSAGALSASELQCFHQCGESISKDLEKLDDENGSGVWRAKLYFFEELNQLLTTPPEEMLICYRNLLVQHPTCQQSMAHALEAVLKLRADAQAMSQEVQDWANPSNWGAADGSNFHTGGDADAHNIDPFQRLFFRPLSEFKKGRELRKTGRGGLFGSGSSDASRQMASAAQENTTTGAGSASSEMNSSEAMVRLHVRVREAEQLRNTAFAGKVDPYVVLALTNSEGTKEQRSEVCSNTTDPKWNEHFVFDVPSVTESQLTVTVCRHRSLVADEVLGTTEVALGGFDAAAPPPYFDSPAISSHQKRLEEDLAHVTRDDERAGKWYDIEPEGRILLGIAVQRLAEEILV